MFLNDSLNAGNGLNYENLKMYPGDIKQWGRLFILCSMRHSHSHIATAEELKIVTPIQGLEQFLQKCSSAKWSED